MKRRMNNIFRADGKSFTLAMDHAAQMYSPDLADPHRIIKAAVAGGVDAFLTSYGTVKACQKDFGHAGIILRADGGSSMIRKPMSPMDCLYTAEDAIRVGADAMLCMGYPGSQTNEHTLAYLGKLAADCEYYNLPLGAEMLPYGFERPKDENGEPINTRTVDLVAFAARQGVELGADFIKTEFVGGIEGFKTVTGNCEAPIMVLGGSKAKSEEELFQTVKDAIDGGAKGVIMGRNICRHENITAICVAIAAIIHDGATVEEALKLL